jgi:hypothetical protein
MSKVENDGITQISSDWVIRLLSHNFIDQIMQENSCTSPINTRVNSWKN